MAFALPVPPVGLRPSYATSRAKLAPNINRSPRRNGGPVWTPIDNLLVSHWPVRDNVAARLTVDTIKRQAADPKLSRAKAFQQAMRAIRNDVTHDSAIDTWAHPNAWAPFSLIGDGAD